MLRHGSEAGNFSEPVVPTCATHLFDGNAPQTPLSQSDILSERTLLRLNFEKDLPFSRRRDNVEIRCQVKETPATAESRHPASGRAAFSPELLTNFPRCFTRLFPLRWLRCNKSNPSAAPAAAVAVCGSCARRGPSSSVGVVVFRVSGLQIYT